MAFLPPMRILLPLAAIILQVVLSLAVLEMDDADTTDVAAMIR